MKLWFNSDYRALFNPATVFRDMAMAEGEVFRTGKGRITLRFALQGQFFFIKRHTGIGWWEIFKDLLQGRLPIIGAINEWRALQRLQILNISSLQPVVFGQQGINPAKKYSFLVTQELSDTISLEDLVESWQTRDDFVSIKRALIRQVARLARRMHQNGLNHRDMYICHIHVSNAWLANPLDEPELFIIDLHRAQIRRAVPQRWAVKDVASLYFSSMGIGLTARDLLRFMRDYRQQSLRETMHQDRQFWAKTQYRADKLYAKRPLKIPGAL